PGLVAWFRVLPMAPDARVFAFLVVTAIVAAAAFGLIPALQATRSSVVEAVRGDFDASFRPSRLRNVLVGAQVMMAVLLLICAGVLLRGAQRVGPLDLGIRTAGVLELEVIDRMRPQVLDELRRQPDVIGVASASHQPINGGPYPTRAATGLPGSRTAVAYVNEVTPDLFDLLDVRLARGRHFSLGEAEGNASVAVVSEATARTLWPDGGALGATLTLTTTDSTGASVPRSVEVIGVSSDVVPGTMSFGTDLPVVFLPTTIERSGVLLVRVKGDESQALLRIERALDARAPGAVTDLLTSGEGAAMQVFPFQLGHWLATVLGVVALLLTASGIYGVVSYVVVQRTKEIGIRLALGASRSRVVLLVARELLRLAGGGIVLGTVLSLSLSKLVASHLVVVDKFDVLAYVGAIAIVIAACAVAVVVPSRRVASLDPVIALKSE
ncbi:MAG: ABC transporter permease, partial [Gemmatimonadaceae bacterium]